MAQATKRAVAGSERTGDNKRHRHDTSPKSLRTKTAVAHVIRRIVPETEVREWLISLHVKRANVGCSLPEAHLDIWKPNLLICFGRRWMFECREGDQTKRHLLVSFNEEGSCSARWNRRTISSCSCTWVDAIWAMSHLSPNKVLDAPCLCLVPCLGFFNGNDSKSTTGTSTQRFAERIEYTLMICDQFVVCGVRWTGHALTAYVRHKERAEWESVSVVPGADCTRQLHCFAHPPTTRLCSPFYRPTQYPLQMSRRVRSDSP